MPEVSPPILLTSDQTAKMLQVSTRTLHSWRQLAIGPRPILVGRRSIRYLATSVYDWIQNCDMEARV
jgi:hypothetical protein